jgi:hypothetical protein
MVELDALLAAGQGHCREALNSLRRLAPGLEHDAAAAVWDWLPRWEASLQALREVDRKLAPLLISLPRASSQLTTYRELQTELLQACTALSGRAQTLKSLTSAELGDLRAGKAAVAGYRPSAPTVENAFTTRG